jgi:hypothetical protein
MSELLGKSVLDRAYQRELLEMLATSYPVEYYIRQYLAPLLHDNEAKRRYEANMVYLSEHGLVESGVHYGADRIASYSDPRINNKGMDFLLDDGGLSAILRTITVRVDATQWAELLASRIEASPKLRQEERSGIAKTIRSLPAKAVEQLMTKMLDWGTDHAADAVTLIQNFLQHVGHL